MGWRAPGTADGAAAGWAQETRQGHSQGTRPRGAGVRSSSPPRGRSPGGAGPRSAGTARHGTALSMTEEIPAAATMPECNGSVPLEDGPLQVIGGIEEIAKSVGTVPYANADTSPDTSPAKENLEENRNSLAEDITPENFAGEKRCQGIVWGCLSLGVGEEEFCFIYSLMNNGLCCVLVKIPNLR